MKFIGDPTARLTGWFSRLLTREGWFDQELAPAEDTSAHIGSLVASGGAISGGSATFEPIIIGIIASGGAVSGGSALFEGIRFSVGTSTVISGGWAQNIAPQRVIPHIIIPRHTHIEARARVKSGGQATFSQIRQIAFAERLIVGGRADISITHTIVSNGIAKISSSTTMTTSRTLINRGHTVVSGNSVIVCASMSAIYEDDDWMLLELLGIRTSHQNDDEDDDWLVDAA